MPGEIKNDLKHITFFKTPAQFRKWLEKYHDTKKELWVGFYRVNSGKPSLTWKQSVMEALCFGWIDGIRKNIDEVSYTIRFTPRKPNSTWSATNIKYVQELKEKGLMLPAGLKAYNSRKENKSGIYSYEQRKAEFHPPYKKILKENKDAFEFFQSQPTYYRKTAIWWVVSAKTEATRLKRLQKLIEHSAKGERIPEFISRKK